jgi:Predicted hydrolase (metallo-beta-lactamase superfamily)
MTKKKVINILNKLVLLIMLLAFVFTFNACNLNLGNQDKNKIQELGENQLAVTFIDVGQGDAILIEINKHYMLIDTGTSEHRDKLISVLSARGIEQFDYVIGTHPHEDHIGSLAYIIKEYDINTLIMPRKAHTTRTFENIVAEIENQDMRVTLPVLGDKYLMGGAKFTIVSTGDGYGDNLNNHSVGIRLEYGDTSFIMAGDAERQAELDMSETGIYLGSDVLKVNHHGSGSSTTDDWIYAVMPAYAVISLGKDNTYGHPDKGVMERLENNGIKIFRTDESGDIIAISDGTSIQWQLGNIEKQDDSLKENDELLSIMSAETINQTDITSQAEAANQIETSNINTEYMYIINTRSGKIHVADCSSVSRMSESNKEYSNDEVASLVVKGYSVCEICKP